MNIKILKLHYKIFLVIILILVCCKLPTNVLTSQQVTTFKLYEIIDGQKHSIDANFSILDELESQSSNGEISILNSTLEGRTLNIDKDDYYDYQIKLTNAQAFDTISIILTRSNVQNTQDSNLLKIGVVVGLMDRFDIDVKVKPSFFPQFDWDIKNITTRGRLEFNLSNYDQSIIRLFGRTNLINAQIQLNGINDDTEIEVVLDNTVGPTSYEVKWPFERK
jgi:hypothetical protein